MGHDINAFSNDPALLKTKKTKSKSHVACLQRGALDPRNKAIYLALYVKRFYGTESGKGDCKRLKSSQIKRAIRQIKRLAEPPNELDYADELAFLEKCNIGNPVWIEFG